MFKEPSLSTRKPHIKKYVFGLLALLLIVLSLTFFIHKATTANPKRLPAKQESDENASLLDYFKKGQSLIKGQIQQVQEQQLTFLAVGDISLSRGVAYKIDQTQNVNTPFLGVKELLLSTDFNFGNLETPFSSSDRYTAKETLVFNAPKPNVQGLINHNFQILSLANNHALDQGLDGLRTTRDWLEKHGIKYTGTGNTLSEAWQPAFMDAGGVRVAFLAASYASINDGGRQDNGLVARIEHTAELEKAINLARSQADFVIVSMHAGTEYTVKPNQAQVDFARLAVASGADMVIGHHPHWVQEKEVYCPKTKTSKTFGPQEVLTLSSEDLALGCKPIYFSLGNFIFDQNWSKETSQGLALKITLTKPQSACHPELDSGSISTSPSLTKNNDNDCNTNLQPAALPTDIPQIQIHEYPIQIENNCCATLKQ